MTKNNKKVIGLRTRQWLLSGSVQGADETEVYRYHSNDRIKKMKKYLFTDHKAKSNKKINREEKTGERLIQHVSVNNGFRFDEKN